MANIHVPVTHVIEYDIDRFSWTAVITGALVSTATIFFLLALGAGLGLSLTSAWEADGETAQTILTLGAIYFLAAQAFGFAVGGHIAGRLIGPLLENPAEERFHAMTHGLASWALCVVATALIVAASGTFLGGSALNAGAQIGAAAIEDDDAAATGMTAYWTDTLFRPDALNQVPPAPVTVTTLDGQVVPLAGVAPREDPAIEEAARQEAGRIVTVAAIPGQKLSAPDRDRLAGLISDHTGLSPERAAERVDAVETQMEQRALQAAEAARKLAQYVSLWTALALLFGSACAAVAARLGREMDDQARALALRVGVRAP